MDEDQNSESRSLSGSGQSSPQPQFNKQTFNAGEYTGHHNVLIESKTSSTDESKRPTRRRRRTRTRRVFLTMAMVGLFALAVLAGVAVLWAINVETDTREAQRNVTSTTRRRRVQ
ncbi:uncharacterized protein LOC111266307 [Varroa jacobsoni]|uniref:Uncharacterized protein n=1 Tax=Varroa destructor TaxID=109461 RepID=A0A7M7MHY2_VARDE|nr:uncharacterized protein LOC111251897 [Varroa destructor]XP_022699417.1 uncharacterized protein LOC111266307 [Varroa jacobsoni]